MHLDTRDLRVIRVALEVAGFDEELLERVKLAIKNGEVRRSNEANQRGETVKLSKDEQRVVRQALGEFDEETLAPEPKPPSRCAPGLGCITCASELPDDEPEETPQALYKGPAGHTYTVADVRHALHALGGAGVDIDAPLERQFALLAESKSPPLRLIAMDYRKRERCDESEWPERITIASDYYPSNETLHRAGLVHLRALSFSGLRASSIYADAVGLLPVDANGERGPQGQALTLCAGLCELVATLANIATLPEGSATAEDVVATFRSHLVQGLTHVRELGPGDAPVIH